MIYDFMGSHLRNDSYFFNESYSFRFSSSVINQYCLDSHLEIISILLWNLVLLTQHNILVKVLLERLGMSLLFSLGWEKIYFTFKWNITCGLCPSKTKAHCYPWRCATQACLQWKPPVSWKQVEQEPCWNVAYGCRKGKYAFPLCF